MARIAFIQNIWAEMLGVLSLSAYVKAHGHATRMFIEPGERNLATAVVGWRPDAIAFSVCTGTHQWALTTARRLRTIVSCPIIFGGNHPTLVPDLIQRPEVDVVCLGEGEEALQEFAAAIDDGSPFHAIANLITKQDGQATTNPVRPLQEDLDSLPFMDRELYRSYPHFRRQTQWPVITTRGCPNQCAYCHNHVKIGLYEGKGTYVRQRSPEHVIAELRELKTRYPCRYIIFWDDSFGLDKLWFYDFLQRYRSEIRAPFFCFILPGHYTEDMIKELKASGCRAVPVAIETGSEQLRQQLLGRDFTPDETYVKLAEWLHRYELPFGTLNMLGLPGETLEDSFTTVRLNWKLKPMYAWSLMFQPYPRTKLSEYCIEHGYVGKNVADEIGPHWYNSSVIRQPQIQQQINLHKLLNIGAQHPRLLGLLKKIIKLPSNALFDAVYLMGYSRYNRLIQNLTWRQFLTVAWSGLWLWRASGGRGASSADSSSA